MQQLIFKTKEKKMLKQLHNNRWGFVVVSFILILGLGCLLWIHYDLKNFQRQYGHPNEKTSLHENIAETDAIDNSTQDQKGASISESTLGDTKSTVNTDDKHKVGSDELGHPNSQENATDEANTMEIEKDEPLTPEEIRQRELRKRFEEIQSQMAELTAKAGGRVNAFSDPELQREMQQLTTELFQILQEGVKDEDRPVFDFFSNLFTMGNRLVDSNGELVLSEYVKIADQMEAAGMTEIATSTRAWAQVLIDKGYETVKPHQIQELVED